MTFTYYYVGDKLTQVYINSIAVQLIYDADGSPLAVRYNGVMYYYVTNLQGDVVALLDTAGNVVVEYLYDAWGNILSTTGTLATTLGIHNPLRYRGYVYDQETRLYYLQSRYYDPAVGRFINADALVSTGQGILGNNMFAYCRNNPVNYNDDNGYFGLWTLIGIGAVVGGLIDYAGQVIANYSSGMDGVEAWTDVNAGEIASAAFSGAISAIPGNAAWGDAVDAVGSNLIEHGYNHFAYGDEFDIFEVGTDIVSDYASDAFLPEILPQNDVPQYIRDIEDEARANGVKGTNALLRYLDLSQASTIVINAFNADTSENLYEWLGIG